MASKILACMLVWFFLFVGSSSSYDVKLSKSFWDGGFLVFPVKREKLQKRLDEINTEFRDKLDGFKLYLPSQNVLHHGLSSEEHVIMIAFGNMTSVSFDEALKNGEIQAPSTTIEGFLIMIPYLSTEKGGPQRMTYQMKLYSSSDGQVKANVVLPSPVVADTFIRESDGSYNKIQFEKNGLKLHVFGNLTEARRRGRNREQPWERSMRVIKGVREFEKERQISLSGADFSICDQYPDLQVDMCDVYRDPLYNAIITNGGANVCIYWVPKRGVKNYRSTFHVETMSDEMKDLLLLNDDEEQDIINGQLQIGNFDIRLVFPCTG